MKKKPLPVNLPVWLPIETAPIGVDVAIYFARPDLVIFMGKFVTVETVRRGMLLPGVNTDRCHAEGCDLNIMYSRDNPPLAWSELHPLPEPPVNWGQSGGGK